MSVVAAESPAAVHAHLPGEAYSFYRLEDGDGVYAHAALSEHADCLELHLEVLRWGAKARRALARDLDWLKAQARARGKVRIIGVKQEADGRIDPRWAKFTKIYGFSHQTVLQTAWLDI